MLLPDNSEYKPVEHPNMAPTRTANRHLSVKERLGSFDEIDKTYTEEEAAILCGFIGRYLDRASVCEPVRADYFRLCQGLEQHTLTHQD